MKIQSSALGMLVAIAAVISCKKGNYERDFKPKPVAADTCSQNVTYSKQVSAIVAAKCATANCHSAAGGQSPALTGQPEIAASATSIRNRINDTGNPMPPADQPQLTPCELAKLNAWISAGSPNN
jgi:mono/diheme cytochrome c family protein